jgi:hypothetical protein
VVIVDERYRKCSTYGPACTGDVFEGTCGCYTQVRLLFQTSEGVVDLRTGSYFPVHQDRPVTVITPLASTLTIREKK